MKINKLLVANRSEIAIRVMRAAAELGIKTVAIYANEDRFALHCFKADESYLVGAGKPPISAYLDIEEIVRIAKRAGADAIHPGYGFLAENPDFAEACERAGLIFIGPKAQVMRILGNKVAARQLAQSVGVAVMPATAVLPRDVDQLRAMAAELAYPLMLKAIWGGGGRGMRVIGNEQELLKQIDGARREAQAAFGNDELYLEKQVQHARHIEVQLLGDQHGGLVHLFERDCSVQRRNQKVIERAPAAHLPESCRQAMCAAALAIGRAVNYSHAGTVEFLLDVDDGRFYFIEVNPRIQVEHTVTEEVTGIDLIKAQIQVAEGRHIGDPGCAVPLQQDIRLSGHAIQCRVTTEDPEQNFTPDYGRITAYRSAAGFGVRLDGGTAYNGAVITPFFDSLLVKVTVWAQSAEETSLRMDRALREFRVRGVATNLAFLENVVHHPRFQAGDCSTRFIDETPELFNFPRRRDRATRLLRFLGETTVNGNPEMQGRDIPRRPFALARTPDIDLSLVPPPGSRDRFKALGADGFVQWIKDQPQVLLTDTTMRDAHQSLLATRMRTRDMLEIAPFYAQQLPQLFSLECWGGATFEVAMRFLHENPWQRLTELRAAVPNILLQMLLRASNAVGYSNYPDNVLRYFVEQASQAGMDVFRVFDALNSVENMRVAMSAVREAGGLCEGTLCYTGDLFDPARAKFNLDYYLRMARELEQAGAHIIGIKDMAGVCRPQAIRTLVHALRQETDLPLHFHTHDTSGMGAASVLAAIDAGVDAVDAAMDAMSGLTSQPNLGAISAALKDSRRDPGLSQSALSTASDYWEGVRRYYAPFEADMRAGSSSVYLHEMPGGQYTNLREQARSLGLGERWGEICQRYAEVNQMFGDIVKVTPTSKVVGDMALYMVAHHLSVADVMNPERQISFPQSVVQLFQGELGMAPEPFPLALQKKILGTRSPLPGRPGALLPPVDLDALRQKLEKQIGRKASDQDLASYLMYPEVFRQFAEHESHYGDVSHLPTPAFFYGMQEQGELAITLEPGKTLLVSLQGQTELKEEGCVKLFFELNGQARTVRVPLAGASGSGERLKADSANPHHLGAAMPGMVAMVAVKPGQKVKKGDALLSIEAMKMETVIRAEDDGTVKEVCVKRATLVSAHDLLLVMS